MQVNLNSFTSFGQLKIFTHHLQSCLLPKHPLHPKITFNCYAGNMHVLIYLDLVPKKVLLLIILFIIFSNPEEYDAVYHM